MKMRWVLRYKESGKPKARVVIVGYHDPRVGSGVRTEALVASRRGRSLFFMATAHNQFSIEKGDVKNAFLQGTFDDKTHGELAAEPVLELRKALSLRELTKACHGLIDAPRRWWKSLVPETQQFGWRSCRHGPCLMTWHVRGRLKGLVCFHVDDVMISGPKGDPEVKRMLDKVKRLYEWGSGNSTDLIRVVAEHDKQRTNPLQLIKGATPERSVSSRCLHTDASTCQRFCQRKKTQH